METIDFDALQKHQFLIAASMFQLKLTDIENIHVLLEQRKAFAEVAINTMNKEDKTAALIMVEKSNFMIKYLLAIM